MEPPQRLATEPRDSSGGRRLFGLYPAGGQDPSGGLAVEAGARLAAVAAMDEILGLAPGAELDTIDGRRSGSRQSRPGPRAGPASP